MLNNLGSVIGLGFPRVRPWNRIVSHLLGGALRRVTANLMKSVLLSGKLIIFSEVCDRMYGKHLKIVPVGDD